MLAKLSTVLKSKVALAALGAIVVGGGGGAVAVAANTGHLQTLGINLNVGSDTKSPDASETPDSHAHSVSVEGLLTACDTTDTPNTVSVTDKAGKSWTFIITSTTRFNGEQSSKHSGGNSNGGASTGDNSANGGSSSGDNSANGGSSSSQASALTLADVCASANLNTRKVEVEATPDGANYDAWKVTLQGAPENNQNNGDNSGKGGDNSSNSGDSSSHEGSDSSKASNEQNQVNGTVTSVGANSFTLQTANGTFTVNVSATTHFSGVDSLSALQTNSQVSVQGTVSGTTITAASVEVRDSSSTPNPTDH